MKICFINNAYEPYSYGGAESVIKILAGELNRQNHSAFIISARPLFRGRKKPDDKVRYFRSCYYFMRTMPVIFRVFWHFLSFINIASYLKIKKIISRENPDAVVLNNFVGIGFLIPKILRKMKIKHIQMLHDIQYLHPSGLMVKGDEKKIHAWPAKAYQFCLKKIMRPEAVVSPSRWLLELYLENGFFREAARTLVAPNPVNSGQGALPAVKKDNFVFLYAGKLSRHKGTDLLIRAFFDLDDPGAELLIAGSGKISRRCSEDLKKNKNISLLGPLDNSSVLSLMQGADCLVMPSLCYENSPTVLYEAAGQGLPCICSDIGGASEIGKYFGCFLFRPGDKKSLLESMRRAIKNPSEMKAMGREAKAKAAELSAEKYIEKLKTALGRTA